MIIGALLIEIIVLSWFHTNIIIIENIRRRIGVAIKNRSEISSDFALKMFRTSLSEWKQLETVIFSSKVTFITIRTIIEYMKLCHIHLYQKIARKKVARVNAALERQTGYLIFIRTNRVNFFKVQCATLPNSFPSLFYTSTHFSQLFPSQEMPLQNSGLLKSWEPRVCCLLFG